MSLVSSCCANTAVLDFGKMIASGPTAEVLRNEQVVRAYLGAEEAQRRERRDPEADAAWSWRRGGRDVVRDVSIEIPPGEVTALLGPNGAGKSSMVLAVGGVLPMKAGSVTLGDRELAGRRPEKIRHAGLAIVPEGRRLLPDLTVEDNLTVATYSLKGKAADGRAGPARWSCSPSWRSGCRTQARSLSGGEQQMVVLAQALVSEPRFVIIDELSLGLAPGGRPAPHPHHPRRRRVRDRGAADRAVRDRGARPGQPRLRDGGRADPVLGQRQGAARRSQPAALGLPAAHGRRRRRSPASTESLPAGG